MPHARSTEFSRVGPFLVLAVTVLILFFARELLVPFAFALTLSFLLTPAVSRLETRRVPRVLAVAITGILASTIICGVGYVVARQLLNVAINLPAYRLSIQKKIASVHSPAEQALQKAFIAIEEIGSDLAASAGTSDQGAGQPLSQVPPVRVIDPNRTQLQSTTELVMRFLRPIGTFGVVTVFTLYLLMKRQDLRHRTPPLCCRGRFSIKTQALQNVASPISQDLINKTA